MAIQELAPVRNLQLVEELERHQFMEPVAQNYLGGIAVRQAWGSKDYQGNGRQHYSVEVEANGSHYRMIYTPPAEGAAKSRSSRKMPVYLANLLGWGENIDGQVSHKTHVQLSHELQEYSIITHETPGIGLDSSERKKRLSEGRCSTDGMAVDNLNLFRQLYQKRNLVATGTSMGSVVLAKMAFANQRIRRNRLDFSGLILFAPALMPYEECQDQFGAGFVTHMAKATTKDMFGSFIDSVKARDPSKFIDMADNFFRSMPRVSEIPVMAAQVRSLQEGIDSKIIDKVASKYDIRVISGKDDPLQSKHMHYLSDKHDNPRFVYDTAEGGHDITLMPEQRARLIANAVRDLQLARR